MSDVRRKFPNVHFQKVSWSYTRLVCCYDFGFQRLNPLKNSFFRASLGLRYTDVQLTRSLMVVTWVFIVLNMPNYIYRMATNILGLDNQGMTDMQPPCMYISLESD
ncbi:hypothetical protein TELCIR_00415 [Teladorsagia circumcincta]|uniref:Uncharacterized protein n=1 Tax=Teladorsagia circumcincta TaxID=45464 RepID=A0A2G9V4N9_TELCI|nr:hypothetical protein TELCIR_00415 [Teladorsagia circumcincta]